jgi:voltage-gated potassium channel
MPSIKSIVEENTTFSGRLFDLVIQCLIVISLISFSVETLPNLTPEARRLLRYIEAGTVAVFTLEYLLRIIVADHKLKFIFSFYGMIDLVAILPFYIATGLDLRSIRAVRLLRLFRMFKLVRYSKAVQRFHRAFLIAREELILFFCVACMLLFFSSVGIYYFENDAQPEAYSSVFQSMWWAIVTLTTVGYGDVYPITTGGRVFTFFVLMVGLGIIAVPTGIVSSALSKARDMEGDDSAAIERDRDD